MKYLTDLHFDGEAQTRLAQAAPHRPHEYICWLGPQGSGLNLAHVESSDENS